ncbi:MAG: methylenetetrahydrofolate--tRNA-(uracil(54)-C(5))-methyltransferase (FADH(2)-oxidizing) TrmFO [Oscillospiraceae bacterium]|jgi:methylenetetrahydrofolate--tRNA-(uracil-5-)-methyltransferase|nr:methylenetetrahydrofolate--tRNA-(uracil(54)-C(5))-methyltransferase (FADH(2)-oxidizing) TrmFO [Oscillospiraceae bacterium]
MVHITGAGLAGCECAFALAKQGVSVRLYEMKPLRYSPAHKSENFAELVCSNSFKAERLASASGMLKEEMRLMASLVLDCAEETRVPAGGALAVDREKFAALVTERIKTCKNIEIIRGEVLSLEKLPEKDKIVIATGPLTSQALSEELKKLCGGLLSFHDAAAPIVSFESINMDKAFFAARYGRGGADYINCPFDKDEYINFLSALKEAETAELHEFERENFRVYEGCMPIETLAKRGEDAIRFGPLRPVGLTDPRTGRRPYAVAQLRKENERGHMYNIVGFQTNLKFGEQKRVFSMIPGLENTEFLRYGVMHRNIFINSPQVLNRDLSLKARPNVYFAGQICGVEGYMESAVCGLVAGLNISGKFAGNPPEETMTGALLAYINDSSVKDFQPMGANMGLLPPLEKAVKGRQPRYQALAERGIAALSEYLKPQGR